MGGTTPDSPGYAVPAWHRCRHTTIRTANSVRITPYPCHRGPVKFSDIAAGLPQVLGEVTGHEPDVIEIDREPPAAHPDQPWLSVKYGPADEDDVHGVTPVRVIADGATHDLVVKVNPMHGIGETIIPWICNTFDVRLPQPYSIYHSAREVVGTGAREANLYDLSITMPELMAILPAYYGTIVSRGERAIILADEGTITGLDAGGAISHWSGDHIDTALRAMGAVHAASAAIVDQAAWLPPRPETATMAADAPLWRALVADAARRVPDIMTSQVCERRGELIDTISRWHPAKDAAPTVIAHNDFNQRNVGFLTDGRFVALDWELVRKDSPQRDVAELLTFTLGDSVELSQVHHHGEQHRQAMAATGLDIPAEEYFATLAADLRSEAIDRVGMQLLFEAAFDLPYVPRINRTVDHLVAITAPWLP